MALLAVGAVLLLMVFAVKAAAVPVQFWLPATYASAPAPVAALFAIMTKVGAYAMIRVYTLIFGAEMPELNALVAALLLPAAALTLIVGAVGVLGAARLERAMAFGVLASMGTLMIAIALFTPEGLTAALYYLVHSTMAAAALFLVADLVRRAQAEGRAPHGLTVAFYFAAAIAIAGMPPLTGFLGKVFVLQAAAPAPGSVWIWAIILVTSLVMIVGFARMGSALFWSPAPAPEGRSPEELPPTALPAPLAATAAALPLAALFAMTAVSGPVAEAMRATATQLGDRALYIDAVLSPPRHADEGLTRGGRTYGPGGHDGDGGYGEKSGYGGEADSAESEP
jgi:multicomponent K+:H+ antiporter subunit D